MSGTQYKKTCHILDTLISIHSTWKGRTAPTCLHIGSPDRSGQPITQPTSHVITLEVKRKLLRWYQREKCQNWALFFDRLLSSTFFLSSIHPYFVLAFEYFTNILRSVSGTKPIKNALCSIDWWFSPFIYTIFDCNTMTANPRAYSFCRWFFNKFVDVIMK